MSSTWSPTTFTSECPSGDPDAARYRDKPGLLQTEVEGKCTGLLDECGFGARAAILQRCVAGLPMASTLEELMNVLGHPGPERLNGAAQVTP
jgi:hypothetical protein